MIPTTFIIILKIANTIHAQNWNHHIQKPVNLYKFDNTMDNYEPQGIPRRYKTKENSQETIVSQELVNHATHKHARLNSNYLSNRVLHQLWQKPLKHKTDTYKDYYNQTHRIDDRSHSSQSVEDSAISNEPTKPWVAPPYYHSLELYEAALKNILSYFHHGTRTFKYDKNFRFIIIAVVVDGLSRLVAKNGWQSYGDNYENLVMYLARNAVVNPQESVEMIQCVFRRANGNIQKIKNFINKNWVQYICKAQPASCDTIIFSHIKICGDKNLEEEGNLLLQIGDAAATYLQSYASVFDAITEQSAYSYVVEGREALRELIAKNAVVLNTLYPKGAPSTAACIEEFGFL